MSHAQGLNVDTPIIPLSESKRFISECLQAVGTPKNHADEMGDLLVEADYRGHYSHGMNRLEMYINDVKSGTCDGKAVPKILKETAATAWVDGQNGLGAVIGNFCMDLAIKKAKEVGIGWVSAKGSNHFGIAGMYTLEAVKEGMLGMSFTNTSPFMAPTRGKQAMLGTNPLSLAAPGKEGDNFVLDMATTAVAVGKIEIAKRKGVPIPEGWAQDKEGHLTTDTANALARGSCLMPLGGSETNSGYKGYGLGFLVEIFCGILGGATYGPNVRKWGTTDRKADLGQCFVAINPNCFAPGFEGRLSDMMGMLRKSAPTDPSKSVLVAGEPEQQHMDAIDKAGGVRYLPNQMESCKRLSEELGVKPLKPLR
ncbi:oxidoreductase-related [Holotrichia oblita]|uniref:Oxidoreductase-related n=1 Tax=Holotrichia oblita TaxID=644536 RepID=A0ACB9TJG9_HOLOL|nr:oxidoreductase-related [Holotrichia oblita]